ncbi:hypothetical protein [Bradyrhizobium sp. USDA 4353]
MTSRIIMTRRLGASVGAPGPRDFTSANCRSSAHIEHAAAHRRPPHPILHVRDDREAPLARGQDAPSISDFRNESKRKIWGRAAGFGHPIDIAVADEVNAAGEQGCHHATRGRKRSFIFDLAGLGQVRDWIGQSE